MLVRSIRQLAEKVKEQAAAPGEPRRAASDRRRRESEKDLQARRYVSGIGLFAFFVALATGGGDQGKGLDGHRAFERRRDDGPRRALGHDRARAEESDRRVGKRRPGISLKVRGASRRSLFTF